MVASQTQGTLSKTFTLDPAMRLRAATDTTSGTETRRILNHYLSAADSPSWINTSTNGGTTWTWQRNVTAIDGSMAILQDATSTPQLQLANPHGDIVATLDDTTTATSFSSYFEQTEYGMPRSTNNAPRYGWLGTHQRSTDDLGGLTLMGVRLYNSRTGRFLSVDPILGGNENPYSYPGDPINRSDTGGACSCSETLTYFYTWYNYILYYGFGCPHTDNGCPYLRVKGKKDAPIPIPSPYSRTAINNAGLIYYVYEIDFIFGGAWVWKWGITINYPERPNSQLPKCRRNMKVDCTKSLFAVTLGYYQARIIEASLFYGYWLKYKQCPPGARKCI